MGRPLGGGSGRVNDAEGAAQRGVGEPILSLAAKLGAPRIIEAAASLAHTQPLCRASFCTDVNAACPGWAALRVQDLHED
ncbi:hypothetical protein IP70_16810 [alpha proteobacterium AAP38]|nr:hypothetical protein IP70_16810 [alpha proteobacterium AAP38]